MNGSDEVQEAMPRASLKVSHFHHEDGVSMVEYVVMIALISVTAIVAINLLGGTLSNSFTSAQDAIQQARGTNDSNSNGKDGDGGGRDRGDGKDRD
ncbi:Flp pilus assembly protein, pilin Flp [Mariprofundus ferrinatatus]|uniref:Flp pilus assembly protein, pilin Flp n=1 Tax=Mariprofundus ferrinatatus TaxID=1921087 RepID=A0A2K8L2V9_9PROT|nr:Flp family type IVb pilin [Mariprofundus ferrinatatus]ATX81670.1 Flp pilus assembly protein, pilin Flp [Mariprofundus ferrinatatus]